MLHVLFSLNSSIIIIIIVIFAVGRCDDKRTQNTGKSDRFYVMFLIYILEAIIII